ncbi:hypothetical protein XOC_4342 [Xanthomonas oryzae pv. oryzicola BLS256]|uniref:Uncharacterized protein n=1 Tax=Xanthomonas oryzae pv. oryzicola (strain BLS256) TaxID=383407 RepID=G7TM57_XANOB|nr:hypothetical protein XOC_4342 [Xanthomonas oryzae pv. oryzicola BLS256]QEO95379.1 hypothetical protein XOCgx_0384 [Xanthomonas oryzae pv. oryzicola]
MAHAAGTIVRVGHDKAPVDSASVYARHPAQDALRRSVAGLQRHAGCCLRAAGGRSGKAPKPAICPRPTRAPNACTQVCIAALSKAL